MNELFTPRAQPRPPAVSVLMPVRNEERSVAGAIRSVLAQSFQELEVLVIDGASDDGTVAAVEEVAAVDPRVRVLHNPARTIPHALNIGLAAAHGRYVARVDAHAAVSSTYLERGVAELDGDDQVAAVGGRRFGIGEGSTGRAVAAALSSPFGVGNSINHYADAPQDTDHASFGVFRADVVRSIGGWDENLLVNEDVDLDHRILQQGHRIRFDPKMEIYWHVRRTVRDLGRQYRRYGRGKAAMVRKNGPSAVRPRHLAAPALVAWLILATLVGVLGHRRLAAAMAAPYVAALGAATTLTLRKAAKEAADPTAAPAPVAAAAEGGVQPLPLVGAFGAMHLGWGLGFLEGYLLGLRPAEASSRDPKKRR